MDLSFIVKKLVREVSEELKEKENIDILKNEILNPIIGHIISELYPYFIKLIIVIILRQPMSYRKTRPHEIYLFYFVEMFLF